MRAYLNNYCVVTTQCDVLRKRNAVLNTMFEHYFKARTWRTVHRTVE